MFIEISFLIFEKEGVLTKSREEGVVREAVFISLF